MQQRAMRQVHPAQVEKSYGSHAQMLLTGGAKRSFRDAERCADLVQIKRPVRICRQEILEPRNDRVMAANTRCGFDARAVRKTSDHDMDELILERPKHLGQFEDFGSVAGKLSNRPVELQEP